MRPEIASDSPLEESGFEPVVPATWPTRSRPSLSPGSHSYSCLRDQLVHREGPTVRIRFPPALSPLRTSFSGGKRGKVRGDDKGRCRREYLKRNRWFESGSLQQG